MSIRLPLHAIFVAMLGFGLLFPPAALSAAESVTYTRKGTSYADVRLDVENAIIAAGVKIDYTGNIAAMLTRTGPDVGSNQPVYKNAEFFTFCSAKLSRQMMEADAANMAHCPYIVFVYERAATVNEVVVGYRKLEPKGRGRKALEAVNAMLDKIARTATK